MPAGKPKIRILAGDLTEQDTEAIVNAANNDLQLGGGVAGAIRRRGGPSIQAECDRQGPIRVGEAALTGGGQLPARYVIHAASMQLGGMTTAESLRSAMDATFRLAREKGIRSLSVPAVGTGIAGFPLEDCARIMRESLERVLAAGWEPDVVRFVLFDEGAKERFEAAFGP